MRCNNCDCKISEDEVHWAYEDPYCEDCFGNLYTYCSRCDCATSRDQILYNNSDEPYCHDCFTEDYDDDAPDNPPVDENDRELIIQLSRSFLNERVMNRRLININTRDYFLSEIRNKVGLVAKSIYLYGLIEREEFQISVTSDIVEELKNLLPESLRYFQIKEVKGVRRLGLSYNIRRDYRKETIHLIKSLTTVKVKEPEQLVSA